MRKIAFGLVTLLWLSLGSVLAQSGVRGVVVNEFANIRIVPALGAELLGTVPSGWPFTANGRSPDNEWLRIDFNGNEGWLNVATLVILEGNIGALPVGDPRSIPYGGFESPRAGSSSATGPVAARLLNGLHMRAGPSTGYPILANPPHNTVLPLLGRTASNGWVQANYNGTLGWIAAQYLELLNGANIAVLPIDGIVADSLPLAEPTASDYISTLRLMLDRVNLAQPSLDAIRAAWADAALAGRAFCHAYPARPSDMNIANPLMAAYYSVLNPLLEDFNDAMYNVRLAIDLFIEVCNQPGTGNPVGQATVQGALGVVNLADGQFASLRGRLTALIPPDRQAGENECLLNFQGEIDILPVIQQSVIYFDAFDAKKYVIGACFDAAAGQNYLFQALNIEGGAASLFISVAPLDNPTSFIAVGGTQGGEGVTVGPALITTPGRYLLIISDSSRSTATSKFAFAISDITNLSISPVLTIDPTTQQVVLTQGQVGEVAGTPAPGTTGGAVACPSLAFTCNQLFTCDEAKACLAAGNFSLDADGDGVPCEEILCPSN